MFRGKRKFILILGAFIQISGKKTDTFSRVHPDPIFSTCGISESLQKCSSAWAPTKSLKNGCKFKNVKPKKMKVTRFEDAPLAVKLVTAGIAGCTADMFTFPLDTAKVRLQVQGEGNAKAVPRYQGIFHTISTIVREEGAKSLYNGLTAGLQRQMCFSSVRIGLYETVKNFYQSFGKDHEPSGAFDLITRISAGVTTGALSVIVAQPTDVVKVRFQAQQGKGERYKSTTEAYKIIFKVEGVRGLWKGFCPNIVRNAVVNVSEIVCYDIVKEAILKRNLLSDNTMCHFISAVIAGFCATVVSSPVDVIKTRYMNSPPGKYKSAVHCAVETVRMEGPLAFYKGFTPSFTRLVAWNIVLWVSYEKLKVFVTQILSEKS